MKITIDIDTSNAAFDNYEDEIENILRPIALKVSSGIRDGNLRDSNGNTVGKFKVTGK